MIGAVIQARLASTRLPGKVVKVMPNGMTVIEYIVYRLKHIKEIDTIIVAMPDQDRDSELERYAKESGAKLFWGAADDVLGRFYNCAIDYGLDAIVRVTCDDPFRDPCVERTAVLKIMQDSKIDYVKTIGLPEGINTEVFTFNALKRAYNEARLKSEHEHVTPYIWKNTDLFRCECISYNDEYRGIRLTLDYPEDWQFICAIDRSLSKDSLNYGYQEILNFISDNPELLKINQHIQANEGYLKSLQIDNR